MSERIIDVSVNQTPLEKRKTVVVVDDSESETGSERDSSGSKATAVAQNPVPVDLSSIRSRAKTRVIPMVP